jgi:hypothetical protein
MQDNPSPGYGPFHNGAHSAPAAATGMGQPHSAASPSSQAEAPGTGSIYDPPPHSYSTAGPSAASPRLHSPAPTSGTGPAYDPPRTSGTAQSYGPTQSYGTDPTSGPIGQSPQPATHPAPTHHAGQDPDQTYAGGYPTSGAGPAYGATPTSGAGPTYGAGTYGGLPMSGPGTAYGSTPTSGAGPTYGSTPTSGAGPIHGGTPSSGAGPTSGPPSWSATDPISATPAPADPYGFPVAPAYGAGPRIEPTPKQPRSRYLVPALAGLLAGLVIFGTGGWFLGRSTAGGDPAPTPTRTTPAPTAAALAPYEQNQVTINQPKFTGPLAPVAQGWLARLSGCSRSGEKGGPVLNKGEKTRVRCEMDAMSVIFVEYATVADRDKARVKTLGQNVDARTLTPGAGAAVERATPSGRTNGNYVEYAYQASGRTVSGIWWDDSATPVAAYLLAYWKEGTGQKWEPMRDVWARYA